MCACVYVYINDKDAHMSRLWTEVKSIAHFQVGGNFTPNFRYELLKTLL